MSEKALAEAEAFVAKTFGAEYTDGPRRYKTKSKGAQEAHEAIRPTVIGRTPEDVARYLDAEELSVYRLIWNRTVASQMTPAKLDKTAVDFSVEGEGHEALFRANGSVVRFPGFLRVYGEAGKGRAVAGPARGHAHRQRDRDPAAGYAGRWRSARSIPCATKPSRRPDTPRLP